MVDPLAEVVMQLRPRASGSKLVTGSGRWLVQRADTGAPFYCAVLDGRCRLTVKGRAPVILESGDFALIPAAFDFSTSSVQPPPGSRPTVPWVVRKGEVRVGEATGPIDVRMLIGHCAFDSPDAGLLVSLLPQFVHVRGEPRLATVVELVRDESRERRPAREVILGRLLEVLFIEALRSSAGTAASPGLLRGLADPRVSVALRKLHERPTASWTVARLAKESALSRSAFFERFTRAVGVAPMAYLLEWRMALAKSLLAQRGVTVAEVAAQVGYSSGSTFSVAFTRHVGLPPKRYAAEAARVRRRGDSPE